MDREQIRKRLQLIKSRLEYASPGPWNWEWSYRPDRWLETGEALRLNDGDGMPVLEAGHRLDEDPYIAATLADYELIANAREDLEWLCSVVEELLNDSKPRGGGEGGEGK